MNSFEITITGSTFRVTAMSDENNIFSVFNYATCHTITKSQSGNWQTVEHRFGSGDLPIKAIGEAIDQHNQQKLAGSMELPDR